MVRSTQPSWRSIRYHGTSSAPAGAPSTSRTPTSSQRATTRLARPAVLIVLALAAARAQLRAEGWTGLVELGMHIQGGLVGPPLEQGQPVGVDDALEDLELLAPGLLHHLGAARLVRLR